MIKQNLDIFKAYSINIFFNIAIKLLSEQLNYIKIILEEEGDFQIISISDNGAGIEERNIKKVFESNYGGNKMSSNYKFEEIVKQFDFKGEFIEVKSYGAGHINDTFVARFKNESNLVIRYILQKVNTKIFKTPENLMENIENVTSYLKDKIVAAGGDPDRETLNLIRNLNGKTFYVSEDGDVWRAYAFIEGAQTYQIVRDLKHFYNAGKALGNFELLLKDFPVDKLHETIPDFHNTYKRFQTFQEAVTKDPMDRAKDVQSEIDFVLSRSSETSVLTDLINEGRLPLRVTHNDTKFNNVMIHDVTGEGVCVIDLDTIMPGLSLYDFGDSIRSGANPAEEDEKDLSKVCMDLDLFESFTHGFLDGTDHSLTELELEYLPFSAKMMTFECGIRFLTDHLNGDIYFKIHRENHNLDRARTQFKMVKDMEEKFEEMKAIVKKYS